MASELIVQTLKGPTSGANANKVIIPSGQTLDIDAWTPPAGTVLQVVPVLHTTQTVVSYVAGTTNYSDTGLEATITPKSTDSVIVMMYRIQRTISDSNNYLGYRILRDSTVIKDPVADTSHGPYDYYSIPNYSVDTDIMYDSPNTTSSVTYKIQVQAYSGGTITLNYIHPTIGLTGGQSRLVLMEIAG